MNGDVGSSRHYSLEIKTDMGKKSRRVNITSRTPKASSDVVERYCGLLLKE
ncbi:hypothetical protein KIN20_035129 [Parelaphostrongylus tenuis]|uniref:Uncharacterized protein n=1 Tax=Parelaphostrongylus tenuis TaxID=148309 RepID=A0AAD5WK85_PARTN|nr:hypothetical protein KIN20_035129 [Parelaphostrongylus tenuis]